MIRLFASAGAEPARGQVEELVPVDLGDRRRVRAAHVVGFDLEAGDRVGVGLGGEQQVAALLEGVGLLGAGVDADHPAPDRGRAGGEDAAEGEVGEGVGSGVLLGGVEVEVLARAAGVAAGHPRLRARPGELGLHPHLAVGRAEAERGPVEAAVALDLGALGGEDPGRLGDVLGADVAQGRGLADVQLDDRVEQRVGLVARRRSSAPRPRPRRPPRARSGCARRSRRRPRRAGPRPGSARRP